MESGRNAFLLSAGLLLAACGSKAAAPSAAQKAAEGLAATCPGQSFEEFLKHFASDARTRLAFTADEVLVADYKDPDSLDEPSVVITRVPKTEYNDFTLKYASGAYHNVDAAGVMDPSPVDIGIERREADYFVRYTYGMSEGNSWLFKPSGACWGLAEDPEPPTE